MPMIPLRIVFMGTPDFAVPALRAIHNAGHEIVAVYCQPPKPVGRGHAVQKTPIHRVAEELGIEVHTPRSLRGEDEQRTLASLAPDAIVVAAYGLILPQAVLDIPRLGCLNIHGSLLPRWRGAAPIHRALLAGDTETGITIMQMEAGLDTGPMLLKQSAAITPTTTAGELHDTLAAIGARLIIDTLELAAIGALHPEGQDEAKACYAAKLTREDSPIDWSQPAEVLDRQVRALNPWPGTTFRVGGETLKILRAELVPDLSGPAGQLLDSRMTVACASGALRLLTVQRAGKGPVDGEAFLRGLRAPIGTLFS